jgi:hypothetical protein
MVTSPVRIGLVVEVPPPPPEDEDDELLPQPASRASAAMQEKYEVRQRAVAVIKETLLIVTRTPRQSSEDLGGGNCLQVPGSIDI